MELQCKYISTAKAKVLTALRDREKSWHVERMVRYGYSFGFSLLWVLRRNHNESEW
jgi:hypothetical protein